MAKVSPERRKRSSLDLIIAIAHLACDQREFELADKLLALAETIVRRSVEPRRPQIEVLVAAHERLWELRHPQKASG